MTTAFPDPYSAQAQSWFAPATQIITITPNDDADIEQGIKALRVWNPGNAAATVRVVLQGDPTPVDLTYPPGLTIEEIRVQRVYDTGTDAGLTIQGHTIPMPTLDYTAH